MVLQLASRLRSATLIAIIALSVIGLVIFALLAAGLSALYRGVAAILDVAHSLLATGRERDDDLIDLSSHGRGWQGR